MANLICLFAGRIFNTSTGIFSVRYKKVSLWDV